MTNYFPYDYHLSITYQAASTTNVAAAQTLGGAGNMTLVASPSTTDGVNHKVTLTSTGNISGVTFTITGTDKDGTSISETLAGPNNNTVSSTNYYSTVTSIAAGGAVGTNTSAGFSALATTRRIPIEHRTGSWNIGMAVDLGGGTATYDVDVTYDDIYANAPNSPAMSTTPTWYTPSAWSAKSANQDGTLAQPCTAVRLRTESYSSTPTIKFNVIQNKTA